jgi:hypothetical protein
MVDGTLVGLAITFMALVAGLSVIFAALRYRTKMLELRHAERLAMIERGLVPPPEMSGLDVEPSGRSQEAVVRGRSMSLGIIVVGFGLALAFLVGIAGGSFESGIGVGGAIAILGGAFIVRSLVVRQHQPMTSHYPHRPVPPHVGGPTPPDPA